MKRWIIFIGVILIGFPVLAASTSLDPLKLGIGARSLSMGRSGAADMCELGTIYINPANTGCFKDWGVTSMQTSLMQSEINYTFLAGAKRFADDGVLGVAYLSGLSSGINSTTLDANGRVVSNGSSFDYTNATFIMTYGKEMKENFRLGCLLKSVSKNLTGQGSANGFNFDLGMTFVPRENLALGLVAQNLIPAGVTWGTGAKENLPMGLKAGINFEPKDDLSLNLDLDSSPGALHSGVEWRMNKNFSLRAGAETGAAQNYSLGAGIELKGVRFDYAYLLDGNLAENSTNYFSLSFAPEEKEAEGTSPSYSEDWKNGPPSSIIAPQEIVPASKLLDDLFSGKKTPAMQAKKPAPKKVQKKKPAPKKRGISQLPKRKVRRS